MTAILFLVLAFTPELKFRVRDAAAAFTGAIDTQILLELLVWAVVAGWIAWYLVRGVASQWHRFSTLNAPMIALGFVAAVVLVSGAHALSIRSAVRALQFIEMVGMTLLVYWEARRDPLFLPEFWLWVRRGTVLFAIGATVITAAIPMWGYWTDEEGVARYAWFEIHPIVTAGILGLTILMLGSMYLGFPDPLLRRPAWKAGVGGLIGACGLLLVQTRSRGAIAATLAALLLLVVLSPRRERRRPAALVATIALALIVGFVFLGGSKQLEEWALRGQTVEQVQSMSQRTELFEIGRELIRQEPVFGQGYLLAGPRFRTHYAWAGHAHNVLLEIAVSMGLLGVFAFSMLLIIVLARFVKDARSRPVRRSGLSLEGVAILILLLVQGVISDSFGGSVGFEVAGLMLVVLVAALARRFPRAVPERTLLPAPDPGAPLSDRG